MFVVYRNKRAQQWKVLGLYFLGLMLFCCDKFEKTANKNVTGRQSYVNLTLVTLKNLVMNKFFRVRKTKQNQGILIDFSPNRPDMSLNFLDQKSSKRPKDFSTIKNHCHPVKWYFPLLSVGLNWALCFRYYAI